MVCPAVAAKAKAPLVYPGLCATVCGMLFVALLSH